MFRGDSHGVGEQLRADRTSLKFVTWPWKSQNKPRILLALELTHDTTVPNILITGFLGQLCIHVFRKWETMSSSNPMEKLEQLEAIEKDVANALQSAGQAILELSKEKPSMKQVEQNTSTFLKTLENVETGLQKHITYLTQVSTGQPHEGSSYASQKVLHMAWHRLEHARSRINELERMKHQHMQQGVRQQAMRQQGPPPPAPSPATGAPS